MEILQNHLTKFLPYPIIIIKMEQQQNFMEIL